MLTTLRFSSPRIVGNRLWLDVDAKCSEPGQSIFGINVRYFYDSFYFKTTASAVQFLNFAPGYGLYFGDSIRPYPGNESTRNLLTLTGLPVYVNAAVQLMYPSKPAVILDDWYRIFTISTELKQIPTVPIYPSFIFDLEYNPLRGSFFPTSEGLVISLKFGTNGSKHSAIAVEQFNWDYLGDRSVKPFGMAVPEVNCNV